MKKVCNKCKEFKPHSEFRKKPKGKGCRYGLDSICKKCSSKKSCEWISKKKRTKDGLVDSIYNGQLTSSKKRSHNPPSYSRNELKEWVFSQELFHTMFDNWVNSGYNRWSRPSVDRLDDYVGYTMPNIQLLTWKQNNTKHHKDELNGINNKQNRAVIQMDLDGNYLNEYHSTIEAARQTGASQGGIHNMCSGRKGNNTSGGFIWKFK